MIFRVEKGGKQLLPEARVLTLLLYYFSPWVGGCHIIHCHKKGHRLACRAGPFLSSPGSLPKLRGQCSRVCNVSLEYPSLVVGPQLPMWGRHSHCWAQGLAESPRRFLSVSDSSGQSSPFKLLNSCSYYQGSAVYLHCGVS